MGSVKLRNSKIEDLDKIYELHKLCFEPADQWYKVMFQHFISNSFVIEKLDDNSIIGFLLQGPIKPCGKLQDDINFIPTNNKGIIFKDTNQHFEQHFGISLLAIHPSYRNKGLAQKLIQIHLKTNPNKQLYLTTRNSNPAKYLYLKMGYEHIANIKEFYLFPTEDAIFMVINT